MFVLLLCVVCVFFLMSVCLLCVVVIIVCGWLCVLVVFDCLCQPNEFLCVLNVLCCFVVYRSVVSV